MNQSFLSRSWDTPCNHLIALVGNGLQVVLYDEEKDYIETHDSEDLGFKFLAHAPIEPPFLKELGFGLAPGYHYLIALRQREVEYKCL